MLANCLDFPTEGRSVLALLAADFNQLSATKHYVSHMKSCLQYKQLRKTQCSCTLTASCQQSWSNFSTSHFTISMLSRWASDYTLLVVLPEPMPKAAVKATLDLPRSATSATVFDDHNDYTFWTMNISNIPLKFTK